MSDLFSSMADDIIIRRKKANPIAGNGGADISSPAGDNNETPTQLCQADFNNFISLLDGWQSKCKNLHWAAPSQIGESIHVRLDEFHDIIADYKDLVAETSMGIFGRMQPNAIQSVQSNTLNATDFINEVHCGVLSFYSKICDCPEFCGIKSDMEQFISNIDKYKYLFSLCETGMY